MMASQKSLEHLNTPIKSLARELGFHGVGITSADPFPEAERILLDRFEQGFLNGTSFNPETIRLYTHPKESFPAARSIISVAISYLTDDSDTNPQPTSNNTPRGFVARFARGLDYHYVMQKRLASLAEAIRSMVGWDVKISSFVDTGTILDRSVAIRAGIGSRGKNTCIYIGEYKSWVVLGELITDLDLTPDEPDLRDICGECDACIKACPTGAIYAPYAVDVRICLSHITQMKGIIPPSLREKLGNRIYGCDTCQSACPLNRDAKPGKVDEFLPSAGLGGSPELIPLLNITPHEFKMRIAPTTTGWIKRTRFRRNIAVALGNIGDPAAVPSLAQALHDPEPIIRAHAAWALGKIGNPSAKRTLESALAWEANETVAAEIRSALNLK